MHPPISPNTVEIDLGDRSYPILIGSALLDDPATYADLPPATTALVVTGNNVVVPVLFAGVGTVIGRLVGLSDGGTILLATMAASASYIAAPTAMRIAVPEANPALSIGAALGVTFPFNVTLGIPLYLRLADALRF